MRRYKKVKIEADGRVTIQPCGCELCIPPIPAPQKAEEMLDANCWTCAGPMGGEPGTVCKKCVEFILEPQWPEQAQPAACVPDDQPDKDLYDWHARAARKKAMADALRGTAIAQVVNREQDPRSTGVARAVANMSRPHDVYMPCGKDWGA